MNTGMRLYAFPRFDSVWDRMQVTPRALISDTHLSLRS